MIMALVSVAPELRPSEFEEKSSGGLHQAARERLGLIVGRLTL
jgi:hypothetical protein